MCDSNTYASSSAPAKSPVLHYPEYIAQNGNSLNQLKQSYEFIHGCSRNFISGKCSNGHHFAKEIICGKEYCKDCGQNESTAHNRRIARWWPKVMGIPKLTYLVITVPDVIRGRFKDAKVLRQFTNYVIEKLKRMGFPYGLTAWHWFGDCPNCKEGCNPQTGEVCKVCFGTGAGREWKPHLNVFINQGYLSKPDFIAFKDEIAIDVIRWMSNKFKVSNLKKNVHANYCKSDGQKVHRLKYVLRSTHRIYNREIAELLKGFRARIIWGKKFFPKPKMESTGEIKQALDIQKSICPCCGDRINWKNEKISKNGIKMYQRVPIMGGYLYLLDNG